jgi:hypothetical protein
MSTASALAPDAAMALGIASTAMPFARTPEADAERWLRILRLYGASGVALQALGVGEGRLQAPGVGKDRLQTSDVGRDRLRVSADGHDSERPALARVDDRDTVGRVTDQAFRITRRRGATRIGTTDLLLAVMCVYGADFDRVLRAYGTDRDEVIRQLHVQPPG